jgi:hypothetical protein
MACSPGIQNIQERLVPVFDPPFGMKFGAGAMSRSLSTCAVGPVGDPDSTRVTGTKMGAV